MKREIKFRGRDVQGACHYGYLFQGITEDNEKYSVILKQMKYVSDDRLSEDLPFAFYKEEVSVVDEEIIGQFTGLYDKYGSEVYEHDYVSMKYKYDRQTINGVIPDQDCYCEGEVVFMEGMACYGIRLYKAEYPLMEEIKSNPYITLPLMYFGLECEDIEVLGNIYDNKELLEE